MTLALRGELGQAGGWQGRAERLLEREQAGDCVERGYLLILRGIEHEIDGDRERLAAIAAEAVAAGERFADPDLFSMGAFMQGNALISLEASEMVWPSSTWPWSPSSRARSRR